MQPVSDVPDVTRKKIAIGARHRLSLQSMFWGENSAAKPLCPAYFARL